MTRSSLQAPFVCVVDDHESVREALAGLLQSLGMRVQTFVSAEAFRDSNAVELAACLILDVHLPGMSGSELMRELLQRGHKLPTIAISARSDAHTRKLVVDAGAHAFLAKPFEEQQLLDALCSALAG